MPKETKIVYVGRKPTMNYVLAVITSFNSSDNRDIIIKARGRAITTAVDVAEIVHHRFMQNLNVDDISIGTEQIQQHEGGARNVSTIEIVLTKVAPEKNVESKTSKDSAELTNINGIGTKRAEKLKSFGVNSVQDLINVDPKELSENLKISEKRVSKWINGAKELHTRHSEL